MSNNSFLDIDDTILQKKLLLPGNGDSEFEDVLKQIDSRPFFIIQPVPGTCIKTKTETGEKVFLNICTSDKIPAPADISDAQLFELLSDEAPSFVIPMSIGSERLESDKTGSLCPTYDIVINTSYYNKCQEKKNFWLFTISIVMDGVSNKFDKMLKADDYVVLKNRKSMGKLQQHRIENREPRTQPKIQKPLIEEISTSFSSSQADNIKSKNITKSSKSNFVLLRYPAKNTPSLIIGLFTVPKGTLGKSITVLCYEDRVVVEVMDTNFMYDISIPYKIQSDETRSMLDKNLGVLRVDMPIKNIKD